jgi:release factor glutamine methyltransferase
MARPGKRGTIRDQLSSGRAALKAAGNYDGWLDAEVLLAHVLNVDRAWLHGHPERPLTASERQRFRRLVDRRIAHVPVAYLTGAKEF